MADPNPEPPPKGVGSIAGNAVGDQPTPDDALGFAPYVEAITAFLTSAATKPPLTMSIEGEWGSGKSSFMLQLERAIRGPSKADVFVQELPQYLGGSRSSAKFLRAVRLALKQQQTITIQFNAWRHDKQDALWAAFALKFAQSLRHQVGFVRGWVGDAFLFLKRLKGIRGWLEIMLLCTAVLLLAGGLAGFYRFLNHHPLNEIKSVIALLSAESEKTKPPATVPEQGQSPSKGSAQPTFPGAPQKSNKLPWPYEFLLSKGRWGALLALAVAGFAKFHKQVKLPISVDLEKYLTKPDYQSRVAFIETFHEDFARVVAAYAKNRRIFVFIDDLDRCDVPRAAELIQALNLMIGDTGNLVFVLGMDREKVAAGITQKYEDLLRFIPEFAPSAAGSAVPSLYFGYSYLEKFIQLSLALPTIFDEVALKRFLSSIASEHRLTGWPQRLWGYWLPRLSRVRPKRHPKPTQTPAPKSDAKTSEDIATDPIARQERVTYLRVNVEKDSDRIIQTILMVAPIFENNPRKLKQFINAFRLALFLCSEFGVLDQREGKLAVTPEQVGKFVATTLRFPDLREELLRNPGQLYRLEVLADGGAESKWLPSQKVRQVMTFGVEQGEEPYNPAVYSLKTFPAEKLTSILPRVPVPVARSATLSFEVTPSPASVDTDVRPDHAVPESAGDKVELTDVSSATTISADQSKSDETIPSDPKVGSVKEQASKLVELRLEKVDEAMRAGFEEGLRILLMEGSANEFYALTDLKRRGHAQNWANLFGGMQRTTNLVQPVPGQREGRPEELEWQIKPELKAAVAAYFEQKDGSTSAGA